MVEVKRVIIFHICNAWPRNIILSVNVYASIPKVGIQANTNITNLSWWIKKNIKEAKPNIVWTRHRLVCDLIWEQVRKG